MTPRGAAALIEMRLAGHRPAGEVWICAGDFLEPDWWRWSNTCDTPELLVRPEDPIDRLDLRCLLDLCVILFFAEWDERIARLYERLQEYTAEIAVMSPAFELDIGWRWIKGIGRIEINEAHQLDALKNAQADAVHAAVKGDQAGYQAAQMKERQTLEAAPWLH